MRLILALLCLVMLSGCRMRSNFGDHDWRFLDRLIEPDCEKAPAPAAASFDPCADGKCLTRRQRIGSFAIEREDRYMVTPETPALAPETVAPVAPR